MEEKTEHCEVAIVGVCVSERQRVKDDTLRRVPFRKALYRPTRTQVRRTRRVPRSGRVQRIEGTYTPQQ